MKKLVRACAMLMMGALCLMTVACGGGAKKDNVKISTADDVKLLKISVQKGTQGHVIATDLVGEGNAEKQIDAMEKYADAILELKQGKVAATIMDEKPALKFLEENHDLMILPGFAEVEQYAMGIKKGNDALTKEVDGHLTKYKADGSLQAILDKYNSKNDVKAADIDMNKGAAGGKFVVGLESGFAPYEYKVGDGIVGVDIEITAKLAKDMGKELVIEDMAFDALPAALDSGKIDAIMSGLSVTEERKQNMNFSTPYFEDAKQIIVIRKSSYTEAGK